VELHQPCRQQVGLAMTPEQIAAVYLVAEMVLSVIARQRVSPAE
jgi:hypothetical protein